MAHNLLWVTLGNVMSGATFTGSAYWFVAESHGEVTATGSESEVVKLSQAD